MSRNTVRLSNIQSIILVALRIAVGWLLLYEGIAKLLIPEWTSAGFLSQSRWLFSGVFHSIAESPGALKFVDFLNIWGLILVGLGMILGAFTRVAGIAGVFLLALYYVASPPFLGTDFGMPVEGHYMFVNKTFVTMMALMLLAVFPSGRYFSLDRFIQGFMAGRKNIAGKKVSVDKTEETVQDTDAEKPGRREALRYLATVPLLGAFAYGTYRKYQWESVNAISGATIKVSDTKLKDLKGELPKGKIKDKTLSRMILGGNLIGGWAHARDLIYVDSLFKAYNHEKKVFETLQLAEKAGIDTINIGFPTLQLMNKYKRIFGSNLQVIIQVHPTKEDIFGKIDFAIDNGADIIQIQGNCTDWRVRDGEIDVLVKALDHIKSRGYVAGLGAHSVQALQACMDEGIKPDFFMKTLHHDQYWSAHPRENRIPFEVDGPGSPDHNKFHNNMFCLFPEETIEFMKTQEIPFMAFKVLAAGAIKPEVGLKFAYENGADFTCVGMFDFQVVDNVNTAIETLAKLQGRTRPWFS